MQQVTRMDVGRVRAALREAERRPVHKVGIRTTVVPGDGSATGLLDTDAVLVSASDGYVGLTSSVISNVVDAPAARIAVVVHVAMFEITTQRASGLETVVSPGAGSVTTTPAGASDGPLFVRVTT